MWFIKVGPAVTRLRLGLKFKLAHLTSRQERKSSERETFLSVCWYVLDAPLLTKNSSMSYRFFLFLFASKPLRT